MNVYNKTQDHLRNYKIISQRLDISETKPIRGIFLIPDTIHLDNCLVDEVVLLH